MAGEIFHEWNGTVLTITSDSGTSSADLIGPQGKQGIRGPQGKPGEGTGSGGSDVDLSNYYTIPQTQEYVAAKIAEAELSGSDVDLSAYALKSEIPSIEGLASESYVNQKIADIPDIPKNVSSFVNDAKYQTEAQVDAKIAAINPSDIDLSNYYTKAEVDAKIPDVSRFQTEEQVLALIQANIPSYDNGDEVNY